MDDEKIKSVIDSFEEEDFMTSSDTLKSEIVSRRDEYLKDKLGLENDITQSEE